MLQPYSVPDPNEYKNIKKWNNNEKLSKRQEFPIGLRFSPSGPESRKPSNFAHYQSYRHNKNDNIILAIFRRTGLILACMCGGHEVVDILTKR